MNDTKTNSKQLFFAFWRVLDVGMTFLLVTFVLGTLGHWDVALTFNVLTIFFGLLVLMARQSLKRLIQTGMYISIRSCRFVYMPICISGAKLSAFFVGVKSGKFCYN